MNVNYILSNYIENALDYSEYDMLEDGTFCGRIPVCKGVISFGITMTETSRLLKSSLEDWVLLGLRLGHNLPIINGIDFDISNYQSGTYLYSIIADGIQVKSDTFILVK
jgi:predicted RNase H-like HicB family nuclease